MRAERRGAARRFGARLLAVTVATAVAIAGGAALPASAEVDRDGGGSQSHEVRQVDPSAESRGVTDPGSLGAAVTGQGVSPSDGGEVDARPQESTDESDATSAGQGDPRLVKSHFLPPVPPKPSDPADEVLSRTETSQETVDTTEWVDTEWVCADTSVTQTRDVTVKVKYEVVTKVHKGVWLFNVLTWDWFWFGYPKTVTTYEYETLPPVSETRLREFTAEEIAACVPPVPVPVEVLPAVPVWVDECGPDDNGYWVYTDTEDYTYAVTSYSNGKVKIAAEPTTGRVFPDGTEDQWQRIQDNTRCPATPGVEVVQPVCTPEGTGQVITPGSVTLWADPGVGYVVHNWDAQSHPAPKPQDLSALAPGKYLVTATPAAGFEFALDDGWESSPSGKATFVFDIVAAEDCTQDPAPGPGPGPGTNPNPDPGLNPTPDPDPAPQPEPQTEVLGVQEVATAVAAPVGTMESEVLAQRTLAFTGADARALLFTALGMMAAGLAALITRRKLSEG